ncbi:polyphosphate polymerase domain-containing protein [Dyadobacter tibetensis]|uniref:polyphosphate polymerase domain-containing protein n=1 Tax=Dyadobacter tibetensis TaxID=1211851 RepID=UPI00047054A8|nr:polyphosphate polymerase domain-containing protein [Dyadobacter tibetensis]
MKNQQTFLSIANQIESFDPISLGEMESVKLMNRMEVKFTLPVEKLADILYQVQAHYRILEMGETRIFDYETLYFDSEAMDLYHQHHAGHLNRYKIRYRNYINTQSSFFEIKQSNNKGRTHKTRIPDQLNDQEDLGSASRQFLQKSTDYDPNLLKPTLWVYYSRLTLVSIHAVERITIDLNLRFRAGNSHQDYGQLIVIEVKQEKQNSASPFLDLMQKMRYKSGGMSKYCLGVVSLYENVKRNRFKAKVNYLNKINHSYVISAASRIPQFI